MRLRTHKIRKKIVFKSPLATNTLLLPLKTPFRLTNGLGAQQTAIQPHQKGLLTKTQKM